jgi:phenylpropionate dioxygenase-like ring-hydroxylating dioxygenase large terminal subunit
MSTTLDATALPAWIYRDQTFFERERELIFRPSWQLVCHQSDIPEPGDYHCLDLLGD